MKLATYARLNERKATVLSRQVTRIQGNDKIQVSKGGKKGDFNKTTGLLLAALGGNKTAPKCDGEDFPADSMMTTAAAGTTKAARSYARELSEDTLTTLDACSTNIESMCGMGVTLNSTLKDELVACKTLAEDFKAAFIACIEAGSTTTAICACVETIDEASVTAMKNCDTNAANDKAKAAKKACKKSVGDCKTAEAAAVEGIDTCKERTSCGGKGIKDKEAAEAALKVLGPLSDALANPAMDNALKDSGLATGDGADGTVPGGRYKANRLQARADGAGCTELGGLWGNFNTSASKTAETADSKLDDSAAKETTSTLDTINGRSTLVEDLQSCATTRTTDSSGRQIDVQITIVKIRFYIFWCGWWRMQVIEIKITIITVTFGVTKPPSVASTAAPQVTDGSTSTKAAKKVARKQMLSNLMKRAALGGPVAN